MRIEEAIQQKQFSSSIEKAIVNLLYSHCWLTTQQSQAIRAFDISIQQYNILRILRGQYPKPASVKLLTERMLDKSSNASRLVDKLHLKGMVERRVSTSDRRQVDVVITQRGLHLLEEAGASLQNAFSKIPLSPQEAGDLSDLLDKMRGNG
jgi:DNA-binding MarR family transcriptional regulator